jgi:hypothetical protein
MGMTTLGSVAVGLVWGWLIAMSRAHGLTGRAALLAATMAVAALVVLAANTRAAVLACAAIAVSAALHLSWRHWLARRYPTREIT